MVGHIDKESLANYYANTDIFIHPNPEEPFGNVVLEAMAAGAAVLCSNSGGVLTYANHENSWLAEPTAESFAKAVRDISSKEEIRRQKSKKAVETAQNNTHKSAIDFLFSNYDRMYRDFKTLTL